MVDRLRLDSIRAKLLRSIVAYIDPKRTFEDVDIDHQIRLRIQVSVFAYAYEIIGDELVSDLVYDDLAYKIDPFYITGHIELDRFFRDEFKAFTGSWIYQHPDLPGIDRYYRIYHHATS